MSPGPPTVTFLTVAEQVPDGASRDVFLCASPALSAEVRRALAALGLPPTQLHEERFDA